MLSLKSFLITLPILGILSMPNYYWRHYNGKVPPDAVTAGDKVYIGRAPFERQRMLLGQITAGVRKLTVTTSSTYNKSYSAHTVDDFIEILCSPLPHSSFQWVTATPKTVLNISGKIEGGYEPIDGGNSLGVLHIGRIHYGRTFKVGKVVGYYPFKQNSHIVNNIFYYASDGGTEAYEYSWEVLVYNERHDSCPSAPKNIWSPDYYWRKYNGEVPCDAVRFDATYIGRGQLKNHGLLVGTVPKGAKYVVVTHSTYVQNVYKFVEILCSPFPGRFKWIRTNYLELLNVKGLVEGGFQIREDDVLKRNGVLYIGKTNAPSDFMYGKVVGYHIKKEERIFNLMYYPYKGAEDKTSFYSVLTYPEQ